MTRDQAIAERENILKGCYGPRAQATLLDHPEAPVDVEWDLYQCRGCGKLESRLTVKMTAPVPVPIYQRCDCGTIMHRVKAGGGITCPRCRGPLTESDVSALILWD